MEAIGIIIVGLGIFWIVELIKETDTKIDKIDKKIDTTPKSSTTIHNTVNIKNTTYVQQNVYNGNKNSNDSKGHTEKVWNDLGYTVMYGESYSYKMYGREIFTSSQVTEDSNQYIEYKEPIEVHTSETGLARKLLKNTGSKRMAKDILVEEYGYSQSEAKSLVGYRGY